MSQSPIVINDLTCQGCLENQPNQLAHMGHGGCLEQHFCMSCGEESSGFIDEYDLCAACWIDEMRILMEESDSESENESEPTTPQKTH
jgi:hypothetical protein